MGDRVQVLDHGYVEFIEDWGRGLADEPEAGIIEAARQSTQGSFRGWEDGDCNRCGWPTANERHDDCCPDGESHKRAPGDARLLKFLFSGRPEHATPFEFAGMTIEVQGPIMVYREWHRHRLQSYCETTFEECFDTLDLMGFNEMSARYAPLPDLNYMPTVERLLLGIGQKNKQAAAVKDAPDLTERLALEFQYQLGEQYREAEELYQSALTSGVPKELARLCLPVGRYSRMRATANLRNWLAFLTLRSDPAAQWEIRQFADQVGQIIAARFPRTWKLFCERK